MEENKHPQTLASHGEPRPTAAEVMVIDANEIVRYGCSTLLGQDPRFTINDTFPTIELFLQCLLGGQLAPPAILVIDPAPGADLQGLLHSCPNSAIVLFTDHISDELLTLGFENNVRGYLPKGATSPRQFVDILHLILESNYSVAPTTSLGSLKFDKSGPILPTLRTREREVLRYLLDGLSDEQIAKALSISKTTVHSHVSKILLTARATNRVQLGAYASRFLLDETA